METQEIEMELELNKIQYDLEKSRGHLGEMSEQDYLALRNDEKDIARNPKTKQIPIERVLEDLQRYGSEDSRLFAKAFLESTLESSRKASRAGRHGKVVYLGVGEYIHGSQFELGLLSAHTPGNFGGGGWGVNGDRRLVLATKRNYSLPIDPEHWLKNTEAFVEEYYGGKLEYKTFGDSSARILLYTSIEKARNR